MHLGSLVAALASYLDAKANHGEWFLRVDDVDQTRAIPGMDQVLVNSLLDFGFEIDGEITYQSERTEHYQDAIRKLLEEGWAYPCICSRKQIAAHKLEGIEGFRYPGTCRDKSLADENGSIRLRTNDTEIRFFDHFLGHQTQRLNRDIGDFVIRRQDNYVAYQLAVVIDDYLDKITHVVRGADLLLSTPRQIYLQDIMGYPNPQYRHIPVVLDTNGKKLSKQDNAKPIDPKNPIPHLKKAWHFLFSTPFDQLPENLDNFWAWAIAEWPEAVTKRWTKHLTNH